jgi:glucose/arabinose dehydrogenase
MRTDRTGSARSRLTRAAAAFRPALVEYLEGRTLLDGIAPSVIATSPLNGAKTVTASANITVTFDRPLNAASVNASTFELRDANSNPIPFAISYNNSNRTVTIDPNSNLPSTTGFYFVRVHGGPTGVVDTDGDPLAQDYVFGFSTGTPQFTDQAVFTNLNNPTTIEFAPDGRVFVAEKRGVVRVFDSLADTSPDTLIDLRTNVHNFWDRGLLGMALHPDFGNNPYVYLLYTYDGDIGQNNAPKWGTANTDADGGGPSPTGTGSMVSGRLTRVRVGPNNQAIGGEEVLIHDWASQFPSHSIGDLTFGPDGMLYASGGDGASFGFADYGQVGNPFGDPTNEGGALRVQDILSSGDPTSLDGTVIRIDPETGAAAPGNPFYDDADPNKQRIIAHGLRNPFRITFRPGTNELWIDDTGWNNWEEINRITNVGDPIVENFGWPAYEGPNPQANYQSLNLPLLAPLYANPGLVTAPWFAYSHSAKVVPGSSEPTGASSRTGLAFYDGAAYPSVFDGALFFSDYSRKQIYVMFRGPDGMPDKSAPQVFRATANGAVELKIGPDGNLYYVDMNGNAIRRIVYTGPGAGANRPPTATITATPSGGAAPLTVRLDASSSTDPDAGDVLSYAWDLDNDGQFDDSTEVAPVITFEQSGTHVVRLQVTDRAGASNVTSTSINVSNSAPIATINSPLSAFKWTAGETINFSGSAVDPQDGTLPASALSWNIVLVYTSEEDPNQQTRQIAQLNGVSSGSFVAPEWDYPCWVEIRLTATDSGGLSSTTVLRIDPIATQISVNSLPAGVNIVLNGKTMAAPFTRTVVAGSRNTISAPESVEINGVLHSFGSWSDGGGRTHEFIASGTSMSLTATYNLATAQQPYTGTAAAVPGTIEAENFDRGGQGIAYNDVDGGNLGGAYRPTDLVDIEANGSASNGHVVGWTLGGEWLEYTVNVAQAGSYLLEARVAVAGSGASMHVEFDGLNATGTMFLPNTGSWTTYQVISRPVTLNAGTQVMRIAIETGSSAFWAGNIDWIRLTPANAPTVVVTASDAAAGEPANHGAFTLTRSGNLAQPLVVNYTISGSAQAGSDYQPLTGTATIPANVSTFTIPVTVLDDTVAELDETVIITLTPSEAYNIGSNASATVTITDNDAGSGQQPYTGTPFNVNQLIEAEFFDLGGEGVSFHDAETTNFGGQLRSGGVDIQNTEDAGGGMNVGWISAGEWLEYTVNIPSAGNYLLELRVASQGSGARFHVEFDGVDKTGSVALPNTGGWQNWQTLTGISVNLSAGVQVMRVSFDQASSAFWVGNFNWIRIVPTDAPVVTVTASGNPSETGPAGGSFTFTRSGDLSSALTVLFSQGGTAQPGGDYGLSHTGSVTIAAGQASATVNLSVVDDSVFEPTETVVLSVQPSGNYVVGAPASATLSITDNDAPSQSPFHGSPFVVPVTIQAEDFDNGGAGIAYSDADAANHGNQYRDTGVDIEATGDVGGGMNVGWLTGGEWLEYTINVPAAGTYTLEVRVASEGTGGTFHVEFDGQDRTGPMVIPNTGSWQTYTTISKTVTLQAGVQVMRLAIDAGGSRFWAGNINWLRLTPSQA